MLIESVDYLQDDNGSIATFGLVDPRALAGRDAAGGKGNKSGSDWQFPSDTSQPIEAARSEHDDGSVRET
jgi:hypothetical protein